MTDTSSLSEAETLVRPVEQVKVVLPRLYVEDGWVAIITQDNRLVSVIESGIHWLTKYLFRDIRITLVDIRPHALRLTLSVTPASISPDELELSLSVIFQVTQPIQLIQVLPSKQVNPVEILKPFVTDAARIEATSMTLHDIGEQNRVKDFERAILFRLQYNQQTDPEKVIGISVRNLYITHIALPASILPDYDRLIKITSSSQVNLIGSQDEAKEKLRLAENVFATKREDGKEQKLPAPEQSLFERVKQASRTDVVEIVLTTEQVKSWMHPSQRLTPENLSHTITPYLLAIADIQHIIDELKDGSPREVAVVSITQNSPISVSLDGASEAIQVIEDTVIPWRRKHAEVMARLLEQEKQADIEGKKAEILETRARAEKERVEAAKTA